MFLPKRLLSRGLPVALLLAVAVLPAVAQEGTIPAAGLSGQSLRPYRFVFYAYAICWALVLGWVVSIARRMAKLDQRLGE